MSHMTTTAQPNGASAIFAQLVNAETVAVPMCTPVYSFAAGQFKKALGNGASAAVVIGCVIDSSIAASATGSILAVGALTATTAQWDAVCGTSGGLTFGTKYYLSTTTTGALTTATTSGVAVIEGLSATVGLLLVDRGSSGGGGTVGPGTANQLSKFATTTTIGDSSISDTSTVTTLTKADANASGLNRVLKLVDPALGTTGDGVAIQLNPGNAVDTYNVLLSAKATATSPSFANPQFTVDVQNAGTTGAGNVTTRLAVTNAGAVVTGGLGVTGAVSLSSTLGVSGATTLSQLIGTVQRDTSITGLVADYALSASTAILQLVPTTAAVQFTGMTGGSSGRMLWILNSGNQSVSFYDSNTNSTAANRLLVQTAASQPPSTGFSVIVGGGMALAMYDSTQSRWQVLPLWGFQTGQDIAVGGNINMTGSVVAGGSFMGNSGKLQWGTGSPAGVVTGNPGDVYLNKSGGANTTLYVKESGTATTSGWTAK